ncbi:hypothetical protein NO113_19475, partial [Clostridioides difficile]|nr:hypothetical protein [Clostridioides difficile]
PEWDTRPSNHYLPRIKTESSCGCGSSGGCGSTSGGVDEDESFEARASRGDIDLVSLATQR